MGRTDWQEWSEAVEAEHERLKKHQVWKPVPRDAISFKIGGSNNSLR
jgi:hypothetical protein